MPFVGRTLVRMGFLLVACAIVATFGLAAYAGSNGVDGLADGHLVGERAILTHVVLYPIAAGLAGSLLTIPALALMYFGDSTLARQRVKSREAIQDLLRPHPN